ncbi:hypothetical protein [Chryseosolibacter indicus]|uniref:G-D-S-L family lipolytic protein n=1 Tax=Chryseosolibacter indicus TaxID=2782351 RepID=A0ABS5VV59_9BACT|nr:hypothetical protein [Chryseosolibacter indicus]MBT1704690.1 hypothetical protein [Chryseosolibacter indicus]
MKKIKYLGYTLALILALSACEQDTIDLQQPEPDLTNVGTDACPQGASKGSADFTKVVAIGNSLMAGYQSGALFDAGQQNSLPKILSKQFVCVGGSETFNQPDIRSEYGFYTGGTNPVGNIFLGRLFIYGAAPAPYKYPSQEAAASSIPNPQVNPNFMYAGSQGAVPTKDLNNFGVPGIVLGQIFTTATGNWSNPNPAAGFNPFYARFASDGGAGTSTILQDATTSLANGGTFFLMEIGNNDVLGYAIGGAASTGVQMTSTADFTMQYQGALQTLLSVPNVKGAVANIPDITSIAYFNTVTWNRIAFDEAKPTDVATVAQLNAAFAGLNSALDGLSANGLISAAEAAKRKVSYQLGNNPILINDEDLEDLGPKFDVLLSVNAITQEQRQRLVPYEQSRPLVAGELVPLGAGAVLGTLANPQDPTTVWGVAVPLPDQYALTANEITAIQTRTNEFNTIIANAVAQLGGDRVALVDVNGKFNQLKMAGADVVNGVTITPTLAPPTGGFSEDGIHPNQRGYAYLANIFIDAINTKFGASVPKVNISKYSANGLPR